MIEFSDWLKIAVLAVLGAIGWGIRKVFGKLSQFEIRIAILEGVKQANEARHEANIQRLQSLESRGERIEDKIDRLIERL